MAQIAGLKAKVAAAEDKKAEIANEAAAKKVARQTTQKSRGDKATAAEAAVPPREAERLPSAAGDSKGRVAQLAAQLQSIPKPAAKKDGPPPTPLPPPGRSNDGDDATRRAESRALGEWGPGLPKLCAPMLWVKTAEACS